MDFVALITLVEQVGMFYVTATCLGAICGGVVSFLLNRSWSFAATGGSIGRQALRYALVWFGSIGLNTVLVYVFTDGASIRYQYSKIITAVLVGTFFNFPLHRYFCFQAERKRLPLEARKTLDSSRPAPVLAE